MLGIAKPRGIRARILWFYFSKNEVAYAEEVYYWTK